MRIASMLWLVMAFASCQIPDIGVESTVQTPAPEPSEVTNPNARGKVKSTAFARDTTATFTFLYDAAGELLDSLVLSGEFTPLRFKIELTESGKISALEQSGSSFRSMGYGSNALLSRIEEGSASTTFAYNAANQITAVRYNAAAERRVAAYEWRGKILARMAINGTAGLEEITYATSFEQSNGLREFFVSQIGVLLIDFAFATPNLLKSESH